MTIFRISSIMRHSNGKIKLKKWVDSIFIIFPIIQQDGLLKLKNRAVVRFLIQDSYTSGISLTFP